MKTGIGAFIFWAHFWLLIWLDWLLDIGLALVLNVIVWGIITMVILIIWRMYEQTKKT